MPKSERVPQGDDEPTSGGSSESGKRGKRKSRPTTKRRNERQKVRENLSKLREDAQLLGIIPTTPEGAVRDERSHSVDPLGDLPLMVRAAMREGWSTPDEAKKAILARLLAPFYNDVPTFTKDGQLVFVPAPAKLLNELAKTILAMDQAQFARDNPEAAGKAKGNTTTINGVPTTGVVAVHVSLESNKLAVQVLREHLQNAIGGGLTALPAPTESHAPGNSRFDGEVETCATSTEDQYGSG